MMVVFLWSRRYFLSVGRLALRAQQPAHGGDSLSLSTGRSVSLVPALSNALLRRGCPLLGWRGDPERLEAERKSFLEGLDCRWA